jgi:predicted DNA-binding transcriptional regulator YafY
VEKEMDMRADRLLALLLYLQNRGRTTTDRLAEELEVSRRTIVRDLYALRVAGFPVYTERGPHGGVHLHEDFRLRLTDLTPKELTALFALGVPAPLTDLGMGVEAKGAMLKLAAALPAGRQSAERDVRTRLYLDPEPWHAPHEVVPTLSALQTAVWEDRWVRATLLRVRRIAVEHEMAPYGLVAKGPTWYVVWRRRDEQLRVDRASDVINLEPLDETFVRPRQFDLAEYWTDWTAAYETTRWPYTVRLRLSCEALSSLERDLERYIERTDGIRPGSAYIDVRMAFDSFEHARAALLAYGGAVEVIEPDALRLSIADFAKQIVATYATGRPASV